MQNLTEKLLDHKLSDKVITNTVIKAILSGSNSSRYSLVNKAINKNELLVLARGIYVINPEITGVKFSKYFLSNQICPLTYISMETALEYHAWIPEAVTVIESITNTYRYKNYINNFGEFHYNPTFISKYDFWLEVSRESTQKHSFLMASPLRALLDLVYVRKIEYLGLDYLINSLRIEKSYIKDIKESTCKRLYRVYKSKRVKNFLSELVKDLGYAL